MNDDKNIVFRSFAMIMQFGFNMLVPIFACTFAGIWLGDRFNMDFLAIPGFIIGVAAGGTAVFRQARSIYKKQGHSPVSDVSGAGLSEFYNRSGDRRDKDAQRPDDKPRG